AASFRIGFPPQTAAGIYQVQFGPHIENLYGVEMAEACLGSFAIVNPILSGVVRLTNGLPLAEVTLRADTSATTTDTSGFFSLLVPPGWSGAVTPEKIGFSFVPASRSYVNVSDNQTNQDFTALVPTIIGPADQSLLVGQNCAAALPDYTGQALATNFTGPVIITQDPVAGTLLGPGGHPVILRASDAFNHLATCSLTVTVADQIPPVLACPPSRTLVADAQMQATLPDLTGQATASDNCEAPSLSQDPVAGTRLAPGSHPVTLTARDAANNSTNGSMTVTVVPPPSLTVAPQDCTNAAGSSVTFTVMAGGTAPLSYQWRLIDHRPGGRVVRHLPAQHSAGAAKHDRPAGRRGGVPCAGGRHRPPELPMVCPRLGPGERRAD
ncbi:MAG: HYR domain-containing protein, partial [Verrucomicrobia bacterium]|nr:HYR domain-containing protein [Verrucomicrobiota bacterium]